MFRIPQAIRTAALCTLAFAAAAPMTGCSKKDKGTENPDEASESDVDPMTELESIPGQIQAELDLVLQPLTDVDVVIDQLTSIPSRHGLNAAELTAMAGAKFDGNSASVELNGDVSAEAKAEIDAMLTTIQGIAVGLKETPARAKDATANLVALGARATAISTKITTSLTAQLSNPLLKAEKKAEIQGQLDIVATLDADIKASIGGAKETVMSVPQKGTEALAKLTAALAGGGSASAG